VQIINSEGKQMYLPEINHVLFDDFLETLIANKEKCKGMYVYGLTVYAVSTKMAILAYGPSKKSKELIGMEVVKAPIMEVS
jgi:hypothetical protein